MPVAIASIMQESNSFSPVAARYEDFSPVFGRAALDKHRGKLTEMGGFIDVLEERGVPLRPICSAWAITAGPMLSEDFLRLADEFEKGLAAAKGVEGLLLSLHGAMIAQCADDAEGHLLEGARRVLGPDKPIVVTLDLHANVTRQMVELADAIIGYRTYPHVDMFEVGSQAADLMLRTLAGEVRPTTVFRKLPLIVPAENMQTTSGPMHALQQRARRFERAKRVEAVSVFGVQPWMDIDEMGCTVVAVGDKSAAVRLDKIASELGREFWDSRQQFHVELVPVEEAIERAKKIDGGPVVLSESSDSTGSGSPGDSTGVLKHLLQAKLTEPACIFLVDPLAVEACMQAGVGAKVSLRIGGGFDKVNSKPVRATGTVRMLSEGRWTPRARGYNPGIEQSMGCAAVLDVGKVHILLAERSTMTVDPELFRSHGLDPLYMKIVVVKSPNGFRAAYEPIAKEMMVVDTPGVSAANLLSLPFKRLPRPIVPLDKGVRLPKGF